MKIFKTDLHIHTCLSPCAELRMTPRAIVRQAKSKGLDIIGIVDHNSAENVIAVKNAGKKENLSVIGGIEVTTSEEVHVLAFFERDKDLMDFQKIIYTHLPGINKPDVFGEQVVVNEFDEVLSFNPSLLIGATTIPISKLVEIIHSLKGIAISAHIDREGFGIIGQLGFVPIDLELDGLEVSGRVSDDDAWERFSDGNRFPIIRGSDSHDLNDIGNCITNFLMNEPSIEEIKMALKGEAGRMMDIREAGLNENL